MSSVLFTLPKAVAVTPAGVPYPSAKAYFYSTGTTTPKNVYTDAALTTPHSSPVQADASGVFPPIYLDATQVYKLTLNTLADVLIYTVDPVYNGTLSQSDIGSILYPRTQAEIAAGVTPTAYNFEPGEPQRLGAATDGSTDATTQLNTLGSVAYKVIRGTDYGSYKVTGAVTFSTGQTVRDIDFVGDPGTSGVINVASGSDQFLVQSININVSDSGAGGGQGFLASLVSATDTMLANSFIRSGRYGVLTNINSGSSVVNGFLNVGNFIKSGIGDAIEYNHPNQAGLNFVTSGVILEVATGSSPSAGFAYGSANVSYSVLAGAVIKKAFVAGIHYEDHTKGAVAGLVSGHAISGHGLSVKKSPGTADSGVDGVVAVGLHLTHDASSNTGHNGLDYVFDSAGSTPGGVALGLYLKGFETGFSLGGASGNSDSSHNMQIANGTARDCTTALVAAPTFHSGAILALNCATLATGNGSSRLDRVYSDRAPATAILTRSDSGGAGVYLKGFCYPKLFSHAGGGAENKTLAALPTRLSGRLTVRWEAGTNGVFWSGEINWDGATLALVTNSIIKHEPGAVTISNAAASGGNLIITLTSAVVIASSPMLIEFEGIWYVG